MMHCKTLIMRLAPKKKIIPCSTWLEDVPTLAFPSLLRLWKISLLRWRWMTRSFKHFSLEGCALTCLATQTWRFWTSKDSYWLTLRMLMCMFSPEICSWRLAPIRMLWRPTTTPTKSKWQLCLSTSKPDVSSHWMTVSMRSKCLAK